MTGDDGFHAPANQCHFARVAKGGGLKIHWRQLRVGSSPTDDISANSVGVCSQTSANAQWQCYGDSWCDLGSVPIPWRAQALRASKLPALIVGVDEVCGKHRLFIGRDSRLRKIILERLNVNLRGY